MGFLMFFDFLRGCEEIKKVIQFLKNFPLGLKS
jgi:hypothetical protein